MGLDDKVWSGREVREMTVQYIYMMTVGEVCGRSDGGVRCESGAASRIGFGPVFLCNGDGYDDG